MTWYNTLSSGDWATWFPGEPVNPGDVGAFDKNRCFKHYDKLSEHGITCARTSEMREAPKFYSSQEGLIFKTKAAGNSAPGFAVLGELDSGVQVTAERAHVCMLQMLDPTTKHIKNQRQVLEEILDRVKSGDWRIDWQVVMKRTQCTSGFAAISQGSQQSLELRAAAKVLPDVITREGLVDLELKLASSRFTTNFSLHPFAANSTPVFGSVVRVKRGIWHWLLPWRSESGHLIDPNGKRFHSAKPPSNLSAYAPADCRYDPARSTMSIAELSSMTVEDIFEEVTSLADEDDANDPRGESGPVTLATVRSFPLPLPLAPTTLAAAGDEDDAPILLDFTSPDDLTQFTLYDRGTGRYWLEVALRHPSRQPSVVAVRYQATDESYRDLLIPVGGDNSTGSSSVVDLETYQPENDWQAWPPVPLANFNWADEIVSSSVQAAVSMDTARAWERVAPLVPAGTTAVIERELEALRGTP